MDKVEMRASPQNLQVILSYAAMERSLNHSEKAADIFKRGLERFPENPKLLEDFALLSASAQDFTRAIELLENALRVARKQEDAPDKGIAGIHHSSLLDIINGGARPGFDTLLRLSIATNVPLTLLIGQKPETLPPSLGSTGQVNHVSIPRRKCCRYDWAAIHQGLSKLQPAKVGISLHTFCRNQRADSGYVSRRLPQLATNAVKEFRLMVSKRHQERIQKEEGSFRALVEDLLSLAVWPSYRKLRRGMPRPGVLRNPKLVAIRKQMLGLAPYGPWKASVY